MSLTRHVLALLILVSLLAWPGESPWADEIRPALLEITEHDGGRVDVVWK